MIKHKGTCWTLYIVKIGKQIRCIQGNPTNQRKINNPIYNISNLTLYSVSVPTLLYAMFAASIANEGFLLTRYTSRSVQKWAKTACMVGAAP